MRRAWYLGAALRDAVGWALPRGSSACGALSCPAWDAVASFSRCPGGAAATENGAGMGWLAASRRLHKVTKHPAGADLVTISVPGLGTLIVTASDSRRGFVTFGGLARPAREART